MPSGKGWDASKRSRPCARGSSEVAIWVGMLSELAMSVLSRVNVKEERGSLYVHHGVRTS